jgi:hypothetical protein
MVWNFEIPTQSLNELRERGHNELHATWTKIPEQVVPEFWGLPTELNELDGTRSTLFLLLRLGVPNLYTNTDSMSATEFVTPRPLKQLRPF